MKKEGIIIYLDPELLNGMTNCANRLKVSRSEIARKAIYRFVHRPTDEQIIKERLLEQKRKIGLSIINKVLDEMDIVDRNDIIEMI